ncbi:hypothetical protein [Alienimonas sp. DA493]|uniref:hypothetical protein n=1 Tax=Alienimonas sp. DA493 TaxID=3373605 RepID=UPI0037552700
MSDQPEVPNPVPSLPGQRDLFAELDALAERVAVLEQYAAVPASMRGEDELRACQIGPEMSAADVVTGGER